MKRKLKFLIPLQQKIFLISIIFIGCLIVKAASKNNFTFFSSPFELEATISVADENVCIDETTTITLTASGGTAPYRFIYSINGVKQERVISDNNSDTVTIDFQESNVGDYEFEIFSIQDEDNAGDIIEFTDKKATITVNAPPTVDFSFNNNNACAGETVQFTSTESGNGDFTYLWDFGDDTTSTQKNPGHQFNTALGCGQRDFDVQLTVTDKFGCSTSTTKRVRVKEKPDISFSDADFGGFSNCGNASPSDPDYSITVLNGSNATCVNSYRIDWGDGNTLDNATFPASHTYSQIGVYTMRISGVGDNGCVNEVTYDVKNVSNPAGGFESPGNTSNLCPVDSELTFGISNYELNSGDTTYTVNFGDGSSSVTLTQSDVESENTITHKYEKGSCGELGNQFTASLTVRNACGTTRFTADNISILEASEPKFDIPEFACANKEIIFKNTSKIGDNLNCTKAANFQWNFGDGTIINDNGAFETNDQTHIYPAPGTYTITLAVSSRCGSDTFTKEICIEPEATAAFTLNNEEGCIPFNVSATNTTNEDELCETPEYRWSVDYETDNCGTTSDWEYVNGTTEASENPEFLFKNPGKYTITQTVITACGSVISTKVVDVKKPPTAEITAIDDFCGDATINPTATIENCTSDTTGISYSWSFTGGTPATANTLDPGNITYDTPGVYEVSLVVTSECGASNTATQSFEVFEKPVITNADLTEEICSGQNTTEITFNTSNPNTTFAWSAVSSGNLTGFTQNGITNNIPSQRVINTGNTIETLTYTVIPTSGICDGDALEFVITVNPSPIITTQPKSSQICVNGTATLLEVDFTNAVGAASYQWFENNLNSNTGGNPIAGEIANTYNPPSDTVGEIFYYAEITFSTGGCDKIVSNTASVNVTEQLTIDAVSAPQILCVGGTADELNVTFSGGTGNPTYQWYTNTTDTNTGGTIINGATNNTYTPPLFTSSGDFYYYAEVSTDGNGCNTAFSDVFEVNVVAEPVLDAQPIAAQELCANATPTNLTVTASGGTGSAKSYQWYLNTTNSNTGGNRINGANSAMYIPETSNVGSFYYYVIVSQPESGCSIVSDVSAVTINEAPIFTTQPISSEICIDGAATPLQVAYANGTGTPSYQWFSNENNTSTDGTLILGATSNNYNPPSDLVGETFYYAIISFDSVGCSEIVSDVASVNVNAQLIVDSVSTPQTLCLGGTADELEVTFSGGTGNPTYQWYANSVNTNTDGLLINGATNSTYTPPVFNTEGSFYYYAEISLSGNGCNIAKSDVFEIQILNDPIIDSQPIAAQELCANATPTDLTVSASGGTGSVKNYQWYINNTNSNTGGNPINGATSLTYTPETSSIGTFYYYVVVSQPESSCEVTSQVSSLTINEAPIFTTQPNSSEICLDDVVTPLEVVYTNGTGTASYQWFLNTVDDKTTGTPITGATSNIYNPPSNSVGETFYYATISFDSGGCSEIVSDVASVKVNEIPVISDAEITIYSEDTFNFDPSNITDNTVPVGTQYTWSTPTFNPAGSILGSSAETTPQNTISQTLENTGTSPVVVTYTIIPATTSCGGNPFTLEVTVNPSISSNTVVTNISCFEANDGIISTNIEGGVPFSTGNPYLISWSGPNGFSSTDASISNLVVGSYTLRIEDNSGFFITEEWEVTQPDLLIISRDVVQNISCFQGNDGTIALTVSGGTEPYTYNWSTADGSGIIEGNKNQNTLTAGTYSLELVDANNCIAEETFVLTEPDGLNISTNSTQDILCFGDATGAISIDVTGGTQIEVSPGVFDYNYSWSGPAGFASTSKNITNLIAGTYTVAVTDSLGCTTNTDIIVNQSPEININFTKTDVSCYGEADGALEVIVAGGAEPYQISWSNFANGFSQSNLTADTYIATITDGNNCVKEIAIDINQPIFFIDPVVQPISCNNANDGSVDLNLTGGVAPITVTWSDDPTAGVQRNNLAAGTYTVTIIDNDPKQCPIEETFTFTNPPAIAVSSIVTDAIDCDIENSGGIDITVSGGTAPLEFAWSNGAITEDLENIPQGDYSVTITDANGCEVNRQFSIFRQPPIAIEFIESYITDCDTKTITKKIEAKTSGGFLPHTLSWSSGTVSGENNEIMTTNQTGAYVLTVTDNSGCEQTASLMITEIPTIGDPDFRYNAFALDNYAYLSIEDPIQFTNISSGNFTKLTWNFGDDSLPVNEENPVHTYNAVGKYTVTLTAEYESGCTYTLTRTVDITIGYKLINPTAFTPNGDGYNETIRPNFAGFTEIEMNIYNTWGVLVYSEKGTSLKGWNGFIKDTPAENGNYIMVVNGITFHNKSITTSTPVTLLK